MKIIGTAGPNLFIAQVSEQEVARLCGFNWATAEFRAFLREQGHRDGAVTVGSSLPIDKAWDLLAEIRRRQDELAQLGERLVGLGDLVTKAWPALIAQLPTAPKE